jgi:hypothetical protein
MRYKISNDNEMEWNGMEWNGMEYEIMRDVMKKVEE